MKGVFKSFFIFRADLGMSSAKLAVQVGHGTDMIHMCAPLGRSPVEVSGVRPEMVISDLAKTVSAYGEWLASDRTKIVLDVPSKEALDEARGLLKTRGVSFCDVVDKGLTELGGVTVTGLVIFPVDEKELPGRVRHMPKYSR
jgi:peptidyl-tRNA hydrolase